MINSSHPFGLLTTDMSHIKHKDDSVISEKLEEATISIQDNEESVGRTKTKSERIGDNLDKDQV